MVASSDSLGIWDYAKAFFGKSFWLGMAKGVLLGVPIGLLAYGLFSGIFAIIPESGVIDSVIGDLRQFVKTPWPMIAFNTVIGGASTAVTASRQAVRELHMAEPEKTPAPGREHQRQRRQAASPEQDQAPSIYPSREEELTERPSYPSRPEPRVCEAISERFAALPRQLD